MHCSSTSSSAGVATAEDAIYALMEYFVAPMLPFVSSVRELPSLPLQESVAKQVHAVVLLYSYYYRKQQPQVEFLGFKSFCQLAVTVKPSLMGHMKLMHHADYAELDDVENQLSVTEKAIMNACDISSALNPSENTPSTGSWEVSKVAVLLIDSCKENCLLQFSSITQGVWSVIEKDIPRPGARFEGEEGKHTNKRKRNFKKSQGNEVITGETDLQQLALSAVKEATGISQGDLVVLESHTVYSLSKEKSTVQFYIVQCTQSINEELRLSTRDIIESLQGPLVRKRNSSWAVTPVVEYFHLLPYAGIMKEWFFRDVISNNRQVVGVGMEKVNVKNPLKVGNFADSEDGDDFGSKSNVVDSADMQSCGTGDHLEQKNDSGTRGVRMETIDVKIPRKLVNSVGSESKNNCKSETNGASSTDMQSRGTDNTNNLQQRNDSGTRGVGLQDVNDKYSESKDKLSFEGYNKAEIDCHKIDSNENFIDEVCKYRLKRDGETDTDSIENKQSGIKVEFSKQITNDKTGSSGLLDFHTGQQNMDIDDSSMIQRQNGNKERNDCIITKVYSHKKRSSFSNSNTSGKTSGIKVKVEFEDLISSTGVPKSKDVKEEDKGKKTLSTICSDHGGLVIGDQTIVPYQLNVEDQNKLQVTQTSKDNPLSQAALTYLLRKKSKLAYQLRNLEDEIAVCDKTIQTILDGGENELALQVEAIVDACYDTSLKGEAEAQEWGCPRFGSQVSPQLLKKTLANAVIPSRGSCQDLDDICHRNGWTLPTYQLYPCKGGFHSSIKLKGMDFEYSENGDLCVKPRLARESAAWKMIAKLQSVAGQSH